MNKPAGYEHFDVEADVGVRAWAPSLAEAFAQTALGVFALIVPPEDVAERETREVRAQGDGLETLLVSWINECLYVHEIEGFAVHRVSVTVIPGAFVHGVLHGEPLDPARHRLGSVVKAATLHGVAVTALADGHETRLVVDV
ncbi:MAG: archease [Candidatus Rokuibacteriota bacterium]